MISVMARVKCISDLSATLGRIKSLSLEANSAEWPPTGAMMHSIGNIDYRFRLAAESSRTGEIHRVRVIDATPLRFAKYPKFETRASPPPRLNRRQIRDSRGASIIKPSRMVINSLDHPGTVTRNRDINRDKFPTGKLAPSTCACSQGRKSSATATGRENPHSSESYVH